MDAIPPNEIGYYAPTAGLGARAARTLRGFPRPRHAAAQSNEWPLNDRHLADLARAAKHRKALHAFNAFCQWLALVLVVAAVLALLASKGYAWVGGIAHPMPYVQLGIVTALALVHFFAGRAALKCRLWGPIAVTALCVIAILASAGIYLCRYPDFALFLPLALALTLAYFPFFLLYFPLLSLIVAAALLVLSLRALTAIPKFLATPLWAQEALVNARL
jgi:hypothetical protein